jgi:hypothetical protein
MESSTGLRNSMRIFVSTLAYPKARTSEPRTLILLLLLCVLIFSCKDRGPLNPLDPDNPNTRGQAYTIQAAATGIGKVKVHWRKVNQPEVKGYRIYRAVEGGASSQVADATDTLYFDAQLQAAKTCNYFYRLIWEDGRELHQSPTAGVVTFNAPTGLTITNVTRNRVEMQWNNLSWLDNYARCRIYRQSGGAFWLYDSTSSTQYVDTRVDTGITYHYKLMAVATDGSESNYSGEAYATPGNSAPVIDSVRASQPFTGWGEQVTITCYAHDNDGDPISYSWQPLDGGTISGFGKTVTFQVPKDSVMAHRVTATVSDAYSVGDQDTIVIQSSDILLSENFEGSTLDPRMTIQTVGTFSSAPGVKNITDFGSKKAFGFGLSTCAASCFDGFVTSLAITLAAPTYVSRISFKEMELFGNWGSIGRLYLDGVPLTPNTTPTFYNLDCALVDFGRQPCNDGQADITFRTHTFTINKVVSVVEIKVGDITSASEIFIDDLSLRR